MCKIGVHLDYIHGCSCAPFISFLLTIKKYCISLEQQLETSHKLFTLLLLSPGEKYEQAIECAKTFLLFHPDDEVMNQNLAYYSAVLGEDKAGTISARQVQWV